MSSTIVRQTFRTALQTFFPAVQYVPSLAERVDNETLEPLWHTIEFVPESDGPVALGTPTCCREIGTARVWVMSQTGAGDEIATTHADAVIAAFRNFRDTPNGIRVTTYQPPQTAQQSDGRWLQLAVELRYSRDYIA